jgi:hypothetical protein
MTKKHGFSIAKMLGIVTGLVMLCTITNADRAPLPPAKTQYDPPTLSCGTSAQSYIEITVTAGGTSAPAGFTSQWETLADYQAHGWKDTNPSYCAAKATFLQQK